MDYDALVKRLRVPEGWEAPRRLDHDGVRLEAMTRHRLDDDVRGINAGLDLIRRTRGGAWPTGPVTAEYNYVDLVWHECELRDGKSFSYFAYAGERYLGCCYLYPMGTRTPLSAERMANDVDVSWWVTPDAYADGYYARVHAALVHALATAFPFPNPWFSNAEMP